MANALFDPGREGFLDGSIDWDTDDIRVMLVKSTYVFSAAHKFSPTSARSTTGAAPRSGRRPSRWRRRRGRHVAGRHGGRGERLARGLQAHRQRCDGARHRLHRHADGSGCRSRRGGQTVNITWDNGANKIFKRTRMAR
jgi:hypothetical protein